MKFSLENGEEDTGFYSIPQGMWYAVQTLTSLGYGDFSPTTLLGKLVGSACAVSGVLVMALPIPIVVDNFGNYYKEQKKLEARELKKEAQEKAGRLVRRQEVVGRQGVFDTVVRQGGRVRAPSESSQEEPDRTEHTQLTSISTSNNNNRRNRRF